MIKINRSMIEKAARALYKSAGWDRPWNKIAPEGRSRFRRAAINTIFAALPTAIMVKRKENSGGAKRLPAQMQGSK